MASMKKLCFLQLFSYLVFVGACYGKEFVATSTVNCSIPAIFTFGDSYVDPGNNNFIFTYLKVNYPPYGQDFINHEATGRNSNGRLVTDIIASYLGIKETVPPYLNSSHLCIDELKTGVSFASAGTGYDPLTVLVANLISMPQQAKYMGEYKTKLENAIGKKATDHIIEESLFVVNCGINDVVNNYFKFSIRPSEYTIDEYLQFLSTYVNDFLQLLLDQGARKIALAAMPPMGCSPIVINKFSEDPIANRSCIEKVSSASRGFNQLIRQQLEVFQTKYEDVGAKFIYLDQYEIVDTIIQNPDKYGFDDVSNGCCTSKFGLCLPFGPLSTTTVCTDTTKKLFWDFIHLTEEGYKYVFDSYRPQIDSIASGPSRSYSK